jgi:hypothetical protein
LDHQSRSPGDDRIAAEDAVSDQVIEALTGTGTPWKSGIQWIREVRRSASRYVLPGRRFGGVRHQERADARGFAIRRIEQISPSLEDAFIPDRQ